MPRIGRRAPALVVGLALVLLLPSMAAAKGSGGGVTNFLATGSMMSTSCSPFSANVTASWTGGTITQVIFELVNGTDLSQPVDTDQVLVTFRQHAGGSYSVSGTFTNFTGIANGTNVTVSAKYFLKGSTVATQWSAVSLVEPCFADLQVGSIALTPGAQPDSYTVHIVNVGNVDADINGLAEQGYYGTSSAFPGPDPACGTSVTTSTIVSATGGSYDLLVSCSLAPPAGDTFLVVGINQDESIPESNFTNDTGALPLT